MKTNDDRAAKLAEYTLKDLQGVGDIVTIPPPTFDDLLDYRDFWQRVADDPRAWQAKGIEKLAGLRAYINDHYPPAEQTAFWQYPACIDNILDLKTRMLRWNPQPSPGSILDTFETLDENGVIIYLTWDAESDCWRLATVIDVFGHTQAEYRADVAAGKCREERLEPDKLTRHYARD